MSRLILLINPFKIFPSELINLIRLFHSIIYHRTHLLVLLCLLTFASLDPVNATLSLYDSSNIELASLSNIDFPFLDTLNNIPLSNYYKGGVVIKGKLAIAKFNIISNDNNFTKNDDPCTLKPIPVGIDLLVVPFDVVQRFGCNFIDDFISRNIWITNGIMSPSGSNQFSLPNGSTILPNGTISYPTNNVDVKKRNENNEQCKYYDQQRSINCNSLQNQKRDIHKSDVSFNINDLLPKVIAFTSLNGGDPGVKEPIYNRDLLRNVSIGLTLLRKKDTTLIQSLNANIDHIQITSNNGPWTLLLQSDSWTVWSIVWGVIYCLISITTCVIMYNILGSWDSKNINLIILPAISFCSLASALILQIDPNGIREDRLSITNYKLIIGFRFTSLCMFYIILQFFWIKATKEIIRYDTHLLPHIRILSNVQRLVLVFSIIIILISTFLKTLNPIPTNSRALLNSSIILETIFIVIVNLGYFTFGIIMIWGLATHREVHQRIGETLIYKFVNNGDKWKAGRVTITLSDIFYSNAAPTISNFWKSRVAKPTSMLLTNLKLDKKGSKGMLHPSIDEEDERINSAAYTTRIAVVRPEPTYRINPNRIDVDLQFGTVRNDSGQIMNNRNNRFLDVNRGSTGEKNLKDNDPSKDYTKLKPSSGSNGNGGKSESNKFDIIDL
ncbi:13756_t:CDS:2 [Cetraspora pellucida]|uniref:13756_t:CDS:1 n=1 Tax=Cetraspora pellucida TaxID=1433469 RepID=A0ACA9JY67_9GLOM|nr:13756_t:CDS:2 [Cetraspora pellucida]